jgi:hypothetical protein
MTDWTQPPLEGLPEGARRRDAGITRVLANPAQEIWREAAYLWLANLPQGRQVTATDLIECLGMPPASPNAVGATIRAASVKGLIKPTGAYTQSTRPIAHASAMRIWERT